METKPRYPKLRSFLEGAIYTWRAKGNFMGSLRDFAAACGVHEVAMGRYMAGIQKPGPEAQDAIAVVTGPGIYVACDSPLRVPPHAGLQRLITEDFAELTEDEISKYLDEIHNLALDRKDAMQKLAGKAVKNH
jgi:hypothetical protein